MEERPQEHPQERHVYRDRAYALALVALLLVVALLIISGAVREGFVSPEAARVYAETKGVLGGRRRVGYREFRLGVGGADAVLHSDLMALNKRGELTPEAVQGVM